jgi:hypothetical protein
VLIAADRDHRELAVIDHEREVVAIGRPCRARDAAEIGESPFVMCAQIVDPEIHAAAPIGRERDLAAIGRPCRIDLDRRIVGHLDRCAAARGQQPQIAHGDEGNRPAVGRHCRSDDAGQRLRILRFEIAMLDRVGRALQFHLRGKGHRRGRAGHRAAADLAVGRVDELGARHPLRAKRKDVLARRHRTAVDEQTAPGWKCDVGAGRTPADGVRQLIRAKRLQHPLAAVFVHRPQPGGSRARIRRRVALVARQEGDVAIGGGPRRHPAIALRQPPYGAAVDGHLPDGIDAVGAVGRERDA